MQFFFADDSAQNSSRNGTGRLLAFGGVLVDSAELKPLAKDIDGIAEKYGLPDGEEIKWSPRKGTSCLAASWSMFNHAHWQD